MKGIKISHHQNLELIDVEDAKTPQAGEVLLKLCYVGFCGSDLSTFRGRNTMALDPVIPGHEVGAIIEEVGTDVPDGLKPGMVVACNPYTNCGKCASCRNGRVNACQHNETLGVQRDGAMREYIVLPWEKVIPAGLLSPMACALIEPMSVGFHAVSRAQVTDIDVVVVIGCGMVGMGAIVRSSLRGATVVAVDIDDAKLEIAKELGAAYTINSRTEDVHSRLMEITSGYGPDVIIEAVGSAPTYQMAVEEVAFTGRVVCIGYARSEVTFQSKYFVQKELDIRGSRNAMPQDFRAVIHYLERGKCPINKLITKIVEPENAKEAIEWWNDNPGKVFRILVHFNQNQDVF